MSIFERIASLVGGSRAPRGVPGARAYAIGDIHGRLDLLDQLMQEIEEDIANRPARQTFLVFVGDYIDRGPSSAGVIERLRTLRPAHAKPIFLGGNHEDVLLRLLADERGLLSDWLSFGGGACALSYGLDPSELAGIDEAVALARLRKAIPAAHRGFIERCADTFRFGDYLFVHAGIRPDVPLDLQDPADLRWIREPFLSDTKYHGRVIVHGHTVVPSVEMRANRIAIDTGAYRSGVLSAVRIEDTSCDVLATGVPAMTCGAIA